jgi:predicted transcriptional regulator
MRTAADAMISPAVAVAPDATVQDASAAMLDARAQAAVVVDRGRVCGLATADNISDALSEGLDAAETRVDSIAERDPPVVRHDDLLAEVHQRMRAQGRSVLPVVDRDHAPLGLLVDHEASP